MQPDEERDEGYVYVNRAPIDTDGPTLATTTSR